MKHNESSLTIKKYTIVHNSMMDSIHNFTQYTINQYTIENIYRFQLRKFVKNLAILGAENHLIEHSDSEQ